MRGDPINYQTRRFLIGGRDFRFQYRGKTLRVWAYEDSARWMVYADVILRHSRLSATYDGVRIIQWYGDPDEIKNDLMTLRLAL